ncbi:MAG: ATP synthase F1 subunit gamma [Candidatus Liptonbacteria bacterium]|nr:ATP synthase F1 subunit gamma [Candidatus Liptonbacteria bacterium]
MESLQSLKQRSKSVGSIQQITKAMELVAATKMRRSQEIALASRSYAFAALELLALLSEFTEVKNGPLLAKRPVKKTLFVVVTSDKGLAGSFNSGILKKFETFLAKNKIDVNDSKYGFIAVGAKAATYLQRKNITLPIAFTRFGDFTKVEDVKPLSDFLMDGYLSGEFDEVRVFSYHFMSALRQDVVCRKILPVDYENLKETAKEIIPETGRFSEYAKFMPAFHSASDNYLIEPSPEEVLGKLTPFLVQMQIYHLILEANASEHSTRRVAMKSASDNAKELSDELGKTYNRVRQTGITSELLEISAGVEALQKTN